MWDEFLYNIGRWNVITGLVIVVVGFVLLLAAKPLARKLWKDKPEEEQTKLTLIFKIAAGVLAIAGCILVMFIPDTGR